MGAEVDYETIRLLGAALQPPADFQPADGGFSARLEHLSRVSC